MAAALAGPANRGVGGRDGSARRQGRPGQPWCVKTRTQQARDMTQAQETASKTNKTAKINHFFFWPPHARNSGTSPATAPESRKGGGGKGRGGRWRPSARVAPPWDFRGITKIFLGVSTIFYSSSSSSSSAQPKAIKIGPMRHASRLGKSTYKACYNDNQFVYVRAVHLGQFGRLSEHRHHHHHHHHHHQIVSISHPNCQRSTCSSSTAHLEQCKDGPHEPR